MSKEMTLIVLGVVVALLPFLGIFSAWKTPLYVLAGLYVMLIGFLLRGEALSQGTTAAHPESKPFIESEHTPRV